MLTLSLHVNDRLIGRANIRNVSNLDPVSNYSVGWAADDFDGKGARNPATNSGSFEVLSHVRADGAFTLAHRVCRSIVAQQWPQATSKTAIEDLKDDTAQNVAIIAVKCGKGVALELLRSAIEQIEALP